MPGLFGTAQCTQRPDDFKSLFGRASDRGSRPFEFESLVDPEHHWALGRVHLGVLQPEQQLDSRDEVHVLFHGDLYNRDEIERLVGATASERASKSSGLVAGLYEQLGLNFASRLDGAYCAAVVDRSRHRVVLVTDAIASYPVYWATTSDGLVFASELRHLLRHPGVRRELNPAAVADYLTFGFPLGVKTLAAGVDLIPPGSTLVFDWETGNVTISRFVNIVDAFQPWTGGRTDYLEALVDAFRRSVGRALSGDHSFGLSLSGGLDSRAILGAADGRAHSIATYTLGVKGCADEVIANQLATIAGTRHTFFELDDRYLQAFLENLERMVELTDGMYMSHGLTELLALGFLASADFSVLLRGHGGELAKTSLAWPLHTDERVEAFTSSQELVPYLLARANYISRHVDPGELFTDSWCGHIRNGAHTSLEHSVAGVSLSPADLCSYLYLTEHHRRTTTASLEIFRQAVEVRLPFVDPVFLHVLFRGAPSWRQDTSIHQTLTRTGNAALLRIRNSNTGAPANAGPLAEWVLDKFNSLFKRLNVYGYRHYHNFHAWMRQQLLATVDAVLLSPESLDRGILRETGVRRLLDDTRQNRADHSYLLQTLLILELWQRQNL
jgi:asparagine synthase (glutamine-hydrolysing)